MIVEIHLPEISENVHEGDVIKVLVKPGDVVAVDQPLIELETEKAVFEVPSTVAGTLLEITVKPGSTVNVGDVIARVGTESNRQPAAGAPASPRAVSPPAPPASNAPASAPRAPVPAPADPPAREAVASAVASTADAVVAVASEQGTPAAASPTVRRLARELGVDINQVQATGPGGRISAEDVQSFAKSIIAAATGAGHAPAATHAPAGPTAARALPDFARFGAIERVQMSKIRQLTASNLSYAWTTVPAVTQNDEADVTDLEAARKLYAPRVEAAGGKLTMTAILTKVCASALKRFPDFNASIDLARNEIVYKKYVNIGVAVDTERGLLVPVIRGVDGKNIAMLSIEIGQVAEKARTKKIMPDDLEGGSFTISNLGGIGGTSFSPIVNAPEVAILGVSRATMKPVFIDGGFQPRLVLPLSLSYDHRLIDGAAAARFLRWVCEALAHPILLSLEG
jgi:pyruvate dehydrogenase E2 component (dihydrolipoyllysine-residue acetyltransferase)